MTYVAASERAQFLVEVNEEIAGALRDGDPDLAAALMLDASMATLGDFEPNEAYHELARRLEQMDEPRMRRVTASVAERQVRGDARTRPSLTAP
jgi:hypothetical protein